MMWINNGMVTRISSITIHISPYPYLAITVINELQEDYKAGQ